jgi:two-component system cell cycle response regulator
MVDPAESTVITVISGVSRGMLEQADACLVVTYGSELGRRFVLDRPEMVIGRSRGCDVLLEQDSTSRRHAVIRFSGGRYVLQDMGSTNGTCVNDESVSDASLDDGDELRLGRTVMRFLAGGDLEQKYRECLVAIAHIDGLTGAMTEAAFMERLADETARARRYERWVGLVVINLVGWEDYSERAGRIYSDLRLRRIAQKITAKLRASDVLARTGESSFTLLLPEADPARIAQCEARLTGLISDELDELQLWVGRHSTQGTDCIDADLLIGAENALVHALASAPESQVL